MSTITLNEDGTLKPWSDAELIAHIRHENTRAQMRGGKLRREQVEEIRELYAEGEMTVIEIGRRFGVTRHAVHEIVSGEKWGYRPLPARTSRRKAA